MPAGRPTDYDPAHCDRVVAMGIEGKSRAQMAAALDICYATWQNWEKAHPEFLAATTRARIHAQAYWEGRAHAGMENREFNASLWSKSMAARFPDDYSDRQKHEHSGPNGGALQVETIKRVIVDPHGNT